MEVFFTWCWGFRVFLLMMELAGEERWLVDKGARLSADTT